MDEPTETFDQPAEPTHVEIEVDINPVDLYSEDSMEQPLLPNEPEEDVA